MKSIVVQFRLKPNHLAKAIDGIKKLNPDIEIESLAQIAKTMVMYGLNYTTATIKGCPTEKSQEILANLTKQTNKNKTKFDPEKILINK